ncbi:MAG: CRISPR-associated endonuclease Cas6 [Chitinophagales bacterium]
MNKSISITKISFPEIKLKTRDAHKLRGYFGNLFKEHSPVLHNHYADGQFRYKYPVVQYKVLSGIPVLVGINEGAELLPQLFLKTKQLQLDGQSYPIHSKNIEHHVVETGYSNQLHEYQFDTLWMALNQKNHQAYIQMKDPNEKTAMLNSILIGQVLSFFTNIDLQLKADERLMAKVEVQEKSTKFKDNTMKAFSGKFVLNALLPNGIGIGRSVSRGFGSIRKLS